jgi:DNA-binding NtrC family response regulator
LGLSMVCGFANQSGGYVTIDSTVGLGTKVTLYLPRAEAVKTEDTDAASASTPAIGHDERIMVIEDDPDVRDVTTAALVKLGYEVIDGGDGSKALLIGYDQKESIDLLLTDVVLPHGNNGPDLADALSRKWQQMKVLMMAGYAEHDILRTTNEDLKHPLIQKSFRTVDLSKQIREMLADKSR